MQHALFLWTFMDGIGRMDLAMKMPSTSVHVENQRHTVSGLRLKATGVHPIEGLKSTAPFSASIFLYDQSLNFGDHTKDFKTRHYRL